MATHRDTVSVLLADALGFGLAFFERMLVLELGAHGDDCCDGRLCVRVCVEAWCVVVVVRSVEVDGCESQVVEGCNGEGNSCRGL